MVMDGFKAKNNILVYQLNPRQLGIEKQLDKQGDFQPSNVA